ncbi:MAG: hypothetical protein ACLTKG_03590 [Collinsella intestinalis]
MTRADSGRRHKWWRESELAYIREHAGKVPAREIRKALRVSREHYGRGPPDAAGRTWILCFSPGRSCALVRMATLFGAEDLRAVQALPQARRDRGETRGRCPPPAPDRATYERTEAQRETRGDPMLATPRTSVWAPTTGRWPWSATTSPWSGGRRRGQAPAQGRPEAQGVSKKVREARKISFEQNLS